MNRKSKTLKTKKQQKQQEQQDNQSDWSEDSIEVEQKDKQISSFFADLIHAPIIDAQTLARSEAQKNRIKENVRQYSESQGNKTTLEQKISKVKAKQQRKEAQKKDKNQPKSNVSDSEEDDYEEVLDEAALESQITKDTLDMEEIKEEEEPEKESDTLQGKKVKRGVSFSELNLIKPLLKACTDMGYPHATPIQKLAIPPVLTGRDVLASAVTGSGKTAAFLLPILQLYFNESLSGTLNFNTTRALIVLPTRELAIQCFEVFQSLNKYTRLSCAVVIGSSSMEKQKVELSRNPLIIIATPGRIIDHVQNTKNFDLLDVDMLVLDEADKLLELGFMYELEEIIKAINPRHQTLLYSATLTGKIEELIQLALRKPIRVSANPDFTIARKLRQEYVLIQSKTHYLREAALLLLAQEFKDRVIIFFKTKRACHRVAILFGLVGMKVKELHGDLTQTERIDALEQFKGNKVNYLLSTDLAARGIDIKQVATVINFELPSELTKYIHRVGRTARAGESGISITICNEFEIKKLKAMIRQSKDQLFKKEMVADDIEENKVRIEQLEDSVKKVIKMELFEKDLMQAEQAASRAENLLKYQDEIINRPRKTWIVTPKQKRDLIDKQREDREADGEQGGNDNVADYENLESKIRGEKNKKRKFNNKRR